MNDHRRSLTQVRVVHYNIQTTIRFADCISISFMRRASLNNRKVNFQRLLISQLDHSQYVTNHLMSCFVVQMRKPYTITKQRERWTKEEQTRFVEAVKLHGRAWPRIKGDGWIDRSTYTKSFTNCN